MADADHDFGGGFPSGRQALRRDAATAGKLQGRINLAGGLTSLALVLGLGFWGYKLAVRDVNGVPVIQALDGPMRITPADPGGEIADNQGLAVNAVAAVGIAAPPPEKLVLAPRPVALAPEDTAGLGAAPMPGLSDASDPTGPLTGPLTGNPDLALAAAPPTESANPTEMAVDAALAEALGEIPDTPAVADGLPPDAEGAVPAPEGAITVSPRPRTRPAARDSVTEAVPEEAVVTASVNEVDPASIAPGTRLVQFGTFDTAEEARAEWSRLQGRFSELMADKALVVQPAESGGRTFYRLRAHGFEGEDDARRFCSAFVSENAVCIPVPQK